jgi:glycosyltransferase involved in cell wall biosynthesis
MLYTKYPHWGGYAGFTQLIRHLDPKRIGVHAHGASDNDDDLPLPNDRLRGWLRERVQRSGMAWYKLSDLAAELRTLPWCLANLTNVVHFLDAEHSGQYLPAWIRAARISRTRTVATYHQPPELLDGLVNRDLIQRIDHVTLMSPAQLPYFRDFLPAERVSVILHGVNCEFFRPDPAARAPGRFKCITSGHWLRDWTAVGAVASKLADLEDVEFHVVTSHPTGLDALPNVTIHRHVDDESFRALYCAADVLFLPLTGSTANNALLEGLASGLPVVSTRLPSIEAYAQGPEAILIDRNATDGLVDALLRLRSDLDLRHRMGQAARARAEALSWANVAPRYGQLYAALISANHNGTAHA